MPLNRVVKTQHSAFYSRSAVHKAESSVCACQPSDLSQFPCPTQFPDQHARYSAKARTRSCVQGMQFIVDYSCSAMLAGAPDVLESSGLSCARAASAGHDTTAAKLPSMLNRIYCCMLTAACIRAPAESLSRQVQSCCPRCCPARRFRHEHQEQCFRAHWANPHGIPQPCHRGMQGKDRG